MPRKETLNSSTVKAIWHEGTSMFVEFHKTGVYEYFDVPISKYNEAAAASSIGSWIFNNFVKGNYKWKKL